MDERFAKIGPIPVSYAEHMKCPLCLQPFKKTYFGKIAVMFICIGLNGKLYCSELHARIGGSKADGSAD